MRVLHHPINDMLLPVHRFNTSLITDADDLPQLLKREQNIFLTIQCKWDKMAYEEPKKIKLEAF